jgi:hypothetical protein
VIVNEDIQGPRRFLDRPGKTDIRIRRPDMSGGMVVNHYKD